MENEYENSNRNNSYYSSNVSLVTSMNNLNQGRYNI